MRAVEGKWQCRCCKKSSRKWSQLALGRCEGAAAARWAERAKALRTAGGSDGAGHLRAAIGDLTWCIRCGAYAVSWAVGLAAPCAGAPMSLSQKRVRNRLLGGRHPRTNARLEGRLVMEAGEGRQVMGEGVGDAAADARLRPQKRKRGLEGAEQPRSTAGYLRRPGGASKAFEETPEGGETSPRQNKKVRITSRVDWDTTQRNVKKMIEAIEKGEQVEDQGGRRRGHGAAPVDRAITQGLVARMAEAIEAGARAAKEMPQVAIRDGSLRLESGGMGGNESQTPEVPTNRRRLLENLKEKVEEAKRRRKAEAA